MIRKFLFFILVFGLFLLPACNQDVSTHKSEKKSAEKTHEKKSSFKKLSDEEIKSIVLKHFDDVDRTMTMVTKEHQEWFFQKWIDNENVDQEKYKNAINVIKEALSPYFSKSLLDEESPNYLAAYFCSCDAYRVLNKHDINARLQVNKQEKNHFTVSFLTMNDDANYNTPGTHILEFIKEEDR